MIKFPQVPGNYFWYIEDWGFFKIGSVHVSKDPEKHLEYLRNQPLFHQSSHPGIKYALPYLYENDKGETLSMYWDANGGDNPHLPPFAENSVRPCVDGFIPYDFEELLSRELK